MKNWQDTRVLIIGAARQGLALARFLARRGAKVTLNDQRLEEQMQAAREALEGLPVVWALGGHPLSLLVDADVICVSGGVPLSLPLVLEAEKRGMVITNDSQIFMEAAPCRVVGITGSAGKTTTTTLVGRMAEQACQPPQKAWVGGNIGLPLVEYLDEIQAADLAVLELSSFQLQQMTCSPDVSAVLNITPNHLDRHGTMEAYTAAKARILAFQDQDDTAVLSREDVGAWNLADQVKGKLITFGVKQPSVNLAGTFLHEEIICLQVGKDVIDLFERNEILLRGEHNLTNVLAACAVGFAAGFSPEAMLAGVKGFRGVPHRLEFVREFRGAAWYNDSIATAPERSMAAIRAFSEPLVLLLGGRDKNLPWQELARLVGQRVKHVIVFGEASPKILAALKDACIVDLVQVQHRAGLEEAVAAAADVAKPGDVVLFSPGGTSFDEFTDFEERGERFRSWVNILS